MMFNYLFNAAKNSKLVQYSAVFFIGSMIINFGNYLFNLLMARMLGVVGYGELQSLLSILVLLSIPLGVVSTIIIKYSANFIGANELAKVHRLFEYFTKKMFFAGAGFCLVIFLAANYLAKFLNLSSAWPVAILGLSVLISFLILPSRSILQGAQKFKDVSVNSIIEVSAKIIFAVLMIWLGFRINGVVLGVVLGTLTAYLFSFWPMKFIFQYKTAGTVLEIKEIFKYSWPVFLTLLSLTLFYTIDVILVKHFFSPEIAGQYSGLATLGRIVFFVSGPIVSVMFSLSARAAEVDERTSQRVLWQSALLVGSVCLGVLFLYTLLPDLFIKLLLGSKFLPVAGLLAWFSLAMLTYSLVNLLSQYFLSVHHSNFAYLLLAGATAEVLLISFWHQNIGQIILILNIVLVLVLIALLLYYFIISKGGKKA